MTLRIIKVFDFPSGRTFYEVEQARRFFGWRYMCQRDTLKDAQNTVERMLEGPRKSKRTLIEVKHGRY